MRVQRRGTTLVEVLVAIFVMALGLIALLTLFPLGALRMSQAIQADRCAALSANAAAIVNAKNLRVDPEILQIRDLFNNPIANDPYASPLPSAPTFPGPRVLDPDGPSYPVMVDPNGFMSLAVGLQHWAPANSPGVLSRRNVSFVAANPGPLGKNQRFQWFNLLDDITFSSDVTSPYQMGSPTVIGPNTIERSFGNYGYSWAYMLQKPRLSEPAVLDTSVIVYRNRSTGLSNENALNEYVYDANPMGLVVSKTTFDTTRNTVIIDYSKSQPPPLRVGAWICDVSYGPAWPPTVNGFDTSKPHGFWYRIVSVSDDLVAQTMEVEVQQNLRGFPANTIDIPGTVLVLEGVVEVYDRGPGR